jgi:selenide,water dikinase
VIQGLPTARRDRRVLVDHATFDDAGVFAIGRGEALVQTVDFFTPVVDDPFDYGRIAAANALSDVYAMGGTPLTALALLGAPDGTAPEVLREILRGGQEVMRAAGCSILGGHSVRDPELKFGYSVTGVARRRRLLTNAGARPGDRVFLTKPLGTGILTTALKRGALEPALLARVTRVMAGLNRAACEVAVEFRARAATDVTGFGLLGHASQLAEASGVSLRLRPQPRWFLPRVLELAAAGVSPGGLAANRAHFGPYVDESGAGEAVRRGLYDPQTSGGLLAFVAAERASAALQALQSRGVPAAEIGIAVDPTGSWIELR